jgi:hypothetical protein
MKMIYITDIVNNNKVAISTDHIVAVYKIPDGENAGKTCVNLTSGHIFTSEEDYDIVAQINNG